MKRKEAVHGKDITIRSSAAEYLTFVAASGDTADSFEIRYQDENIWLTQKMMAALYDVSISAISQHIRHIYYDGELIPEATVKKYLTVQTEGDRRITRHLDHYNLQMIIAVGFKVNNPRAFQFRKWAGQKNKGLSRLCRFLAIHQVLNSRELPGLSQKRRSDQADIPVNSGKFQ